MQIIQYQKENNSLGKKFLEMIFFENWRLLGEKKNFAFSNLEVYMGTKCNLACKYCYLNRYGEKLYPKKFEKPSILLSNLSIFLDWLLEKKIAPLCIEFFAGEPLIQEHMLCALELILEKFKLAQNRPKYISVPTNFTFLLDLEKRERVERLIEKSRHLNLPILLSASIDGKFCEKNRPFNSGKEKRDEKFYSQVFQFAKKYTFGFHPMIYSILIEKWPKNFLWFQKNFDKFKIPWHFLYLLEVRNEEWTREQILNFSQFIKFLIIWTFQKRCHCNIDEFLNFLFNLGGFNILVSPFIRVGRGLGCSLQTTLTVRIGDLKIVPCHRTSYPQFELAQFKVKNGKIYDIEILNPSLLIAIYSHDAKNQPYCERCLLRELCSFGCLGAQYEANGDLFTPIPTVCQLQFAKIFTIIKTYKELGILEKLLSKVDEKKQKAILTLLSLKNEI